MVPAGLRGWALTVCGCAAAALAHGQQPAPTADEVKAAFVYNFVGFVDWPLQPGDRPGSEFVVGVLGEDPFEDVLEEILAGKTVREHRPVVVKRFRRVADLDDAKILFISSSEQQRLPEILDGLRGRKVLTVGDGEGFAERGGMIGFRLKENRVRLEINLDSAERAGLKISSQLLKLATIVRGGR